MLRRSVKNFRPFGFIGLGQMGARMAPNIFKDTSITELVVFDVSAEAGEGVAQTVAATFPGKKVTLAVSPSEVAEKTNTIVTMLPNGKIVSDVYEKHLVPNAQAGTVFLDCSTIDPDTPKQLAAAMVSKGALFFDAPVSGGINAAAAGTLTFMVGSPRPVDFSTAEATLKYFGKSVVNCGATGSGQVCKLCNNLILGQHMVAVSEAMLMGTRLGVNAATLAQIFNTSTGRCWSSDTYNPYPGIFPNIPSSNGYKGGFGAALMLKDLGLALDAAASVNLEVKGAANAHSVYTNMVKVGGMGSLDFSGVLKFIDESSSGKN